MAELGPRACVTCGPKIEGCWKCQATIGHRHVQVLDRRGHVVGSVAACDVHAPVVPTFVHNGAQPTQGFVAASREAKRQRDRERRRAQRRVLDRHRAEVDAELARIRGGSA